jgi:hypothetical protein
VSFVLTERHIKLLRLIDTLSDGGKESFFNLHGTHKDRSLDGLEKFGVSSEEANQLAIELQDGGYIDSDIHVMSASSFFLWLTKKGKAKIRTRRAARDHADASDELDSFVQDDDAQIDKNKSTPRRISDDTKRQTAPNDNLSKDFYDNLRALNEAMAALSRDIRAINDPDRVSSDIKAVRAYIDGFRAFLDVEPHQPPVEVPTELSQGLLKRLRQIDWMRVSENAQKWADTIIRIISKFFI